MDKFRRAEGILRREAGSLLSIESPPPASRSQIDRIHPPSYIDSLRFGTLDRAATVRLGLLPSASLLKRSALEVGGTLAATAAALTDGLACNLAGGTHHAFADRGLGFCVLNDVAIAIAELRSSHPDIRCMVIDTDAHQGNGTNGIFADDPNVFTYSIHVGRNYPAEKTPGSLDVPLPRYVSGLAYLEQLEATLPSAVEDFSPDFVFWIAGADLHRDDRFGQMNLEDDHFAARDRLVLGLISSNNTPTAVLYGGGYNRDREHTARLHAGTVLRVRAAVAPER